MKFEVQLLNYDSEWVRYCAPTTLQFATEACADLRRRGFQQFQTRIVRLENL